MGKISFYYGKAHERGNVDLFKRLMAEFPEVKFFQPDFVQQPWHIQTCINGTFYNFWPHKMKGCRDGSRAVEGYGALQKLLLDAMLEKEIEDYSGGLIEDE